MLEKKAPSIITRANIFKPLQTEIFVIDFLFPIGRRQQQALLSDRTTRKTSLLNSIVAAQQRYNRPFTISDYRSQKIIVLIACIDITRKRIFKTRLNLAKREALFYTTLIDASTSCTTYSQYVSAYTTMNHAKYYRDCKVDTLVILNNLSNHTITYRKMALLTSRTPGRETYPGDIFYIHTRLLEKAEQMAKRYEYASITAIPVIETKQNNISTYIPTNIISIYDDQ